MGSQRFSLIVACVPILSLMFGRLIVGDSITWMECVAIALITAGILYGAFFHGKSSKSVTTGAQMLGRG